MHSTNLSIYRQINKKPWVAPTLLGLIGGVVGSFGSNLSFTSQILFQALYWTIGYKVILIIAGAGMGWQIGNISMIQMRLLMI